MEAVYAALTVLAVTVLGALTALIKAKVDTLVKDLGENTTLTKEAKEASNGRLSETLARLAAERDRVIGLRYLVRERDDRIAYIVARLPEAEALMTEYRDRRDSRLTQADELAAEQHAMTDS
jgi:hypothetical protein